MFASKTGSLAFYGSQDCFPALQKIRAFVSRKQGEKKKLLFYPLVPFNQFTVLFSSHNFLRLVLPRWIFFFFASVSVKSLEHKVIIRELQTRIDLFWT